MDSIEHASSAWLDAEALVAIVGLTIALSVAAGAVAAITNGRVIDDTRPAIDGASTADDGNRWPYVFGA